MTNDDKVWMYEEIMTNDDKVWMYEEIMTNDDNLESNLLTSSLLRRCVVCTS